MFDRIASFEVYTIFGLHKKSLSNPQSFEQGNVYLYFN